MLTTYTLLSLTLIFGAACACFIQQRHTPLPQEVLLERLSDKKRH